MESITAPSIVDTIFKKIELEKQYLSQEQLDYILEKYNLIKNEYMANKKEKNKIVLIGSVGQGKSTLLSGLTSFLITDKDIVDFYKSNYKSKNPFKPIRKFLTKEGKELAKKLPNDFEYIDIENYISRDINYKDRSILPTASGRTTVCDYQIEFTENERLEIEIVPETEVKVFGYIDDFSRELYEALYLTQKNETSGYKILFREVEIGNFLSNSIINNNDYYFKGTNENERLENFKNKLDKEYNYDYTVIPNQINTILKQCYNISQRECKKMSLFKNDWKIELQKTLNSINKGLNPSIPFPKKIKIMIPKDLIASQPAILSDFIFIDSKGIDNTVLREDLEEYLREPKTSIVLMSDFNNAPSTASKQFLLEYKSILDDFIQDKISFFVNDKKGESCQVNIRSNLSDTIAEDMDDDELSEYGRNQKKIELEANLKKSNIDIKLIYVYDAIKIDYSFSLKFMSEIRAQNEKYFEIFYEKQFNKLKQEIEELKLILNTEQVEILKIVSTNIEKYNEELIVNRDVEIVDNDFVFDFYGKNKFISEQDGHKIAGAYRGLSNKKGLHNDINLFYIINKFITKFTKKNFINSIKEKLYVENFNLITSEDWKLKIIDTMITEKIAKQLEVELIALQKEIEEELINRESFWKEAISCWGREDKGGLTYTQLVRRVYIENANILQNISFYSFVNQITNKIILSAKTHVDTIILNQKNS